MRGNEFGNSCGSSPAYDKIGFLKIFGHVVKIRSHFDIKKTIFRICLPDVFKKGSNAKSLQTGQYTIDAAERLKIDFQRIDLPNKEDQIHAAQDICNLCYWSELAREGFDGLLDWRKRKNEALSTPDKPIYYEEALKTWGRHVGDAFCGIAIAYRYMEIGGKYIGATEPDVQYPYDHQQVKEKSYALDIGGL